MSRDEKRERIDEIATDVDDLKTDVEELADDPPPGVKEKTVDSLREALEQATDAADDLEDQSGEP